MPLTDKLTIKKGVESNHHSKLNCLCGTSKAEGCYRRYRIGNVK